MPTVLGPEYSTSWRGRYPHMLKEDYPVWTSFISSHAKDFIRLFYDVRVGGPVLANLPADKKLNKMWYDLNAKRIDVLAEKRDELWIIEVAARPGLRALGQLCTYCGLWLDDPKIKKPAVGVLVCEDLDPDLGKALFLYGMLGVEVG
jgi:hypothetical protein